MLMKKIIFSLMLMIIGTTFLFAQAPERVQTTFKTKYPDAQGTTWITVGGNYQATYMDKNGVHNVVVFNNDGSIVRTESEMNMKEYPTTVTTYYEKNYPDEKNYHVWVVTDADGNKTYYIPSEHKGVRYYFDKTGNYLRQEKNKAKDEMKEHMDNDK
jgi:hypothetical protein